MMLKEEVGEFSYLQALYSSWMLIASFSAYTLLLKNISADKDQVKKAQNITSAILLSAGGIVVSTILFLLIVEWNNKKEINPLYSFLCPHRWV